MTNPPTRSRGRTRNEESRLAILTAAYELTSELGYPDVTIEGVAARAGSGKQTVYRWWPTKADILLEALAFKADLRISTKDRGSLHEDLGVFLRGSAELLTQTGVVAALRALMAEAQNDPAFKHRFQDGFIQQRRRALRTLFLRASERGDAPPQLDTGPGAELGADLVFGLIWYRILAGDPVITDRDIAALQQVLTTPSGKD